MSHWAFAAGSPGIPRHGSAQYTHHTGSGKAAVGARMLVHGHPEARVVRRSHAGTRNFYTGDSVSFGGSGDKEEPAPDLRRHVRRRARFVEVEAGPHTVVGYGVAHLLALQAAEHVRLWAGGHYVRQLLVVHARSLVGPRAQFHVVPN